MYAFTASPEKSFGAHTAPFARTVKSPYLSGGTYPFLVSSYSEEKLTVVTKPFHAIIRS